MAEQNVPGDQAEMPVSEPEVTTTGAGFPPYPPYTTEPAPPSVADTIIAGRDLRVQHKSTPRKSVRLPPRPAKAKGAKVTDVKMSKRTALAHARCLRRHGAVLTDRLERMSKPPRRSIIYLWREYAHTLPAETIARLRAMLDADEPFKPDQAYEYFINLRKTKNKVATARGVNRIKKDVMALYGDKRIVWARNATVAFARGIQQRLSRPGAYTLADRMLRLSNIILEDICCYMHMNVPSRRCTHPKAKFMMEMSDKVTVWIDEILAESDDRMLMMDFDEDNDIIGASEMGEVTFTDNFLNMMGGGGLLKVPQPAYLHFTGEMLEAFMILTESMYKKEDQQLLSYGKFQQTYTEAANELKETSDFNATEYNTTLASKINGDLTAVAKPNTPNNIAPYMKDMVEICSNFLAQHAEFNKDKGPAFKLLVKTMRAKGNDQLYQKGKAKRSYANAATELENARGLESDHDDPNLSQEIHSNLSKLTENQTPADLKVDMKGDDAEQPTYIPTLPMDTLNLCSKYLSQRAIDEIERGPAFDILIKELEKKGAESFTPQFPCVDTNFAAAYILKSAPGLSGVVPDESKVLVFKNALHRVVDVVTPKVLVRDMNDVIGRCANYLSAFVRDRDKAMQTLLKMMKSKPSVQLGKRNNYIMNYDTAASEIENAPNVVPYLPIKDIADEGKSNLTRDMEGQVSPDLKLAVKALIQDASRYLSQPVAMRSGVAGERYPLNFLTAVKQSLGSKPLFKYKAFGQTYADAAEELKYAGTLECDPKCEMLQHEISTEMKHTMPSRLAPTITSNLSETMEDASKHLAKIGSEKGEALQHLVNVMKEQGETPLGQMQGYQQSYVDGARRIENANSLANNKVDKGVYESVREKLTSLTEKKPAPQHAKHMPAIVDDSSKFLAAPFPENEDEKRKVLADLMARKGDEILIKEGIYKVTYTEGGEEIMNAPVGLTKAQDENTKKQMLEKVNAVIPEKKLQNALKQPANEGAAYLTDVVKGRAEVMQVLHDEMKKEKDKELISVGKFSKTHEQAAQMLEEAPHFGGQRPSPVLEDIVADKIKVIPTTSVSEKSKPYVPDASEITTKYIAGVATEECGLDAKALAALQKSTDATKGTTETDKPQAPPPPPSVSDDEADTSSKKTSIPRGDDRDMSKEMEDRLRRMAELEEARRKAKELEEARKKSDQKHGQVSEVDIDRERALQILHDKLRARGAEVFYKQPHTELTHAEAAKWLTMEPAMKVDKSVKDCGDTARLHIKFERKLNHLVGDTTPANMHDVMQDVVIESSRILSEYFVSKSFKVLVGVALISEMQKRGNEILIEVDNATETFFFAAQRLKKTSSLEVNEPCSQVAYRLTKKLEDIVKCRSMPRKIISSMKDHIVEVAQYLSAHVTKPDEQIEAYVALLNEMEAAGSGLLVEGDIPKSYKDAATYLRQLTTFQDMIALPNSSLQSNIEGKLKILMDSSRGNYNKTAMSGVISETTSLLVSYIVLQGTKTEALKVLTEEMERECDNVLLRHGNVRRTFGDGADALRTKNSDQLSVPNADPVVSRKIQIKLRNLMNSRTPEKYLALMDDVIEDATMYLAVHFLQPHVIQVCKCMNNVFVQCELWSDEILRRVAKPCCNCSRHISLQNLSDDVPGTSKGYTHGIGISLTPCPSKTKKILPSQGEKPYAQSCPAKKPSEHCKTTTSYLLYSSEFERKPFQTSSHTQGIIFKSPIGSPRESTNLKDIYSDKDVQVVEQRDISLGPEKKQESTSSSLLTSKSTSSANAKPKTDHVFWQSPTTMFARVVKTEPDQSSSLTPKTWDSSTSKRTLVKRGYNTRAPIITTDQMADWHAMMVSLTWNIQAWRRWIQENIDRALNYRNNETEESWTVFQRQTSTDALQWRQYNNFSRQLTYRLALRYRDKKIVSPTRATLKTEIYMKCQQEMLDIIDMFHTWTQWLTLVIRETDSIDQEYDTTSYKNSPKWEQFKSKVEEYVDDWKKYNTHLKVNWEQKYKMLITDWLPELSKSGAMWVVSACGAVPSGAVAAGVYEGEVIWVARTTHKCSVLPAALHPSKHCCTVYSDGKVHHYTKYQVMCNAEVSWMACRATDTREGLGEGPRGARAVRVAAGVLVGRVLYRGAHLVGAVLAPACHCHVVIYGRPFAFNCYELLVLAE